MKRYLLFLIISSSIFAQSNCELDSLTLSIPDGFGRQIIGSSGSLKYCVESTRYFKGEINLQGLLPNHDYILTINGKPNEPGNNCLPKERSDGNYLDAGIVHTNAQGLCSMRLRIRLKSSDYEVRFFLKDKTDYVIVLHNDYLSFSIAE